MNFTVEICLPFSLFKSQSIPDQELYEKPDYKEEEFEKSREREAVRMTETGCMYAA